MTVPAVTAAIFCAPASPTPVAKRVIGRASTRSHAHAPCAGNAARADRPRSCGAAASPAPSMARSPASSMPSVAAISSRENTCPGLAASAPSSAASLPVKWITPARPAQFAPLGIEFQPADLHRPRRPVGHRHGRRTAQHRAQAQHQFPAVRKACPNSRPRRTQSPRSDPPARRARSAAGSAGSGSAPAAPRSNPAPSRQASSHPAPAHRAAGSAICPAPRPQCAAMLTRKPFSDR